MSIVTLKMLALIAMLIDHIVAVFGWEGWNILSINVTMLRYIGRISFPVFAFCIVNGWRYTLKKEKYFLRLTLCAILSQIPFSLAFYPVNTFVISEGENAYKFSYTPIILIIGLLCVVSYWYFVLHKKFNVSLLLISTAYLLPAIFLKVNYMWVLSDNLNVLYTLTTGCIAIYIIEKIKEKELHWWEYLWLVVVIFLVISAYAIRADYGINFMGVALIVALYFTQPCKVAQSIIVFLWGCVLYGLIIGNWQNALATIIPAILVLLYNPKKGGESKFTKKLFYTFYPFHLLIIGIIKIY